MDEKMVGALIAGIASLIGAVIGTFIGVPLTASFARGTHASNRLFEKRIEALTDILRAFNEMKGLFASEMEMGFLAWSGSHRMDAGKALDAFRRTIDNSQVMLPASVIDVLRKLDSEYFVHLGNSGRTSYLEFSGAVQKQIDELNKRVNKSMSKGTHRLNVKFRF